MLTAMAPHSEHSRRCPPRSPARAGGLVVAPVDPASLAPALRRMIWKGAYVGAVVPPPATSLLNAPQYLTGKTLGDAAASYIRDKLGGKANVVLLTHDSLQFLSPRFVAMARFAKRYPWCGDRRRYFPAHCE